MRVWRAASGISVLAVSTYLLVEGAQGNEAAIREAKTSWINALGGTLGVEGQADARHRHRAQGHGGLAGG